MLKLNNNPPINFVPKDIHFIWLGGLLNEVGRNNINQWFSKNNDYQMHLWVDSGTYPATISNEYKKLIQWGEANKVLIHDLNLISSSEVIGEKSFYENMLSKQFYDEELTGTYRNLAAASDILRVEILYRRGGVYLDTMDIFPGKVALGDLYPRKGFLVKILMDNNSPESLLEFNNDLLASAPQGEIITQYRVSMNNAYLKLQADQVLLQAHRNNFFFLDPLIYNKNKERFINYRFITTLKTSGPTRLIFALAEYYHFEKDLSVEQNVDEFFFQIRNDLLCLSFDRDKYDSTYTKHAFSWIKKDLYAEARLFTLGALNKEISEEIESIFTSDNIKLILKKYQSQFSKLPLSVSFSNLHKVFRENLLEQEIKEIDKFLYKWEDFYFLKVEKILDHIKRSNEFLLSKTMDSKIKKTIKQIIDEGMDDFITLTLLPLIFQYSNIFPNLFMKDNQFDPCIVTKFILNLSNRELIKSSSTTNITCFLKKSMQYLMDEVASERFNHIELSEQFSNKNDKESISLLMNLYKEFKGVGIMFHTIFPYFLEAISELDINQELRQKYEEIEVTCKKLNKIEDWLDYYPCQDNSIVDKSDPGLCNVIGLFQELVNNNPIILDKSRRKILENEMKNSLQVFLEFSASKQDSNDAQQEISHSKLFR